MVAIKLLLQFFFDFFLYFKQENIIKILYLVIKSIKNI